MPSRVEGRDRLRRRWAPAVTVVIVVAVAWPITRPRAADSFPMSNYPMFTADKDDTTVLSRALGTSGDGSEHTLSPRLAGGTVEVMHALHTIERAVADGTVDELCREIADRVADAVDGSITTVIVVTERYDVVEALTWSERVPVSRRVDASCQVDRG